jgi:exopolysaccharide biosynthesis polyprenyl glycosylphosphotransferase
MAGYSWSIFRATVLTVSVLLAIVFFLKIPYVSRFVLFLFAFLEFCMLMISRAINIAYFKRQVKSGKKVINILIIGSRGRAQELVMALQEKIAWGVNIVGFIDPDPLRIGAKVMGIPVIGNIENTHECLKNNVIDEVIIAIPRSLLDDAEPIVMACEEEGIRLRFMADIFNVQVARISLSEIKGIPLLTMEPVAQDPQQLLAKRVFDLTCTLLAVPFLIPVFIFVAFIIKIDSPGPIFFIQPRVGMRKHVFPMFKFRSMYIDAEEQLKEIEHLNEAEGPIFKIKNDPRVTWVGRLLRKTSIDELPQLINVLRGEMSLVGPRPMSLRDVDLFERGTQRKRFSVQPGLTCIWQISGRSNLPFEKWLELDLEYIENWSFWLDLEILFKTIPAVIKSKGAA